MPTLKQIIVISALAIGLILGVAAYAVFKTPAQASAPLEAIPLASSEPTRSAATTASPAATVDATATRAPEATATQPTAAANTGTSASAAGPVTLRLSQDESQARFIIDEVLNNAPKTVVGTTNQVAGEIAIDPQRPAQSRVGVIQINARTLTTDSDLRNRTIKNQILQTDQYELITFTPVDLVGLPQTAAVGQPYTFQITGDLTIRDVTKRVTFDVTATAASQDRVQGTATTTIRYADYGITIPQVRQVASVAENVRLELDFVALTA